ncbi:hypothetical protein PQ455_13015 [Sphingomonas naphthae]|uniref:DUF1761 domain-containing protein n=1 Tax=Sphingomonas naphthae TaxID=1813468 RepID=A0ABY7THM4_9SPHN|nr:hypothetical protein [Sphingomonas naphthae]WCT72553.1 hypothetical protein PQ455_13015 [Sphingomonas naphthae]
MTAIVRLILGSLIGAVAMFFVGFLFWVTPLANLAYTTAPDNAAAATQTALAQNLTATGTGTYMIPSPSGSAANTVLYGRGPIATIHFNTAGFPVDDAAGMISGYIHNVIVALMMGFALYGIAGRVTDFASRAKVLVLITLAGATFAHLGTPIWLHFDWAWAIFSFVSDVAMLLAGGLVIARWFLPLAPAIPLRTEA